MNLKLSKSKFRVVLTEVLPYERPLFYSNRFFARFLKHYDVSISGNRLAANRNTADEGIDEVLTMLSGVAEERFSYSYFISKDGMEKGRCLTVMHPFHQVKTMELYDRYGKLIIDFCRRSKFSIRFPSKVASLLKWNTKFDKLLDDDAVEEKTTESAKSYFHYEEFSNISKFLDSYKFLNIEKRFERLLKVDISKCFDSIIPKLLSRLIYDNGINTADELSENDFVYDFIRLHEEMRVGQPPLGREDQEKVCDEKGIIIGPEVSRLFAEIFLQQIDKKVEEILKTEHKKENPKDYAFCRYVDDSFIAANSIDDIFLIKDVYSKVLGEYGLKLKEEKITLYPERPFIDGLSLIKTRLRTLVVKTFENRLSTFIGFQKVQEGEYASPVHHTFKSFISELRVLVAETYLSSKESLASNNDNSDSQKSDTSDSQRVDNSNSKKDKSECKSRYKDVTSFVFGIMEGTLLDLLQDFNDLYREYSEGCKKDYISDRGAKIKEKYESEFGTFCIQLIESLFFILNSDLRMSTSISVVRILDIIQRFVRGKYIFRGNIKSKRFQAYLISKIDEKITDETVKVLEHVFCERYNLFLGER